MRFVRDPGEPADLLGDDLRELLVVRDSDNRDEVPFPRHGVGLGDALQVGQGAAQRRERVALGLDQDDRVGEAHGRSMTCAPGARPPVPGVMGPPVPRPRSRPPVPG